MTFFSIASSSALSRLDNAFIASRSFKSFTPSARSASSSAFRMSQIAGSNWWYASSSRIVQGGMPRRGGISPSSTKTVFHGINE